jgi:NAD(P)-dependent dehydrogenase (short-subunit alcohol dehydrogenase family)
MKPVILVTGCASGIGLALARLLLKQPRYRVVVTARAKSVEKLKKEFEGYIDEDRFIIRVLNVSDDFQRRELIDEINNKWGGVNVLVNNAGISYRAVIEHMTEDDEIKQMATNYLGPMGLIRLVLPNMRLRGRGKIINVSSVSGMLSMPTMGSYSASKHALEGACESLWYEAKPYGIDVCLVQPGFIHSKSFRNVYYTEMSDPKAAETSVYKEYYKNMTPFIEKMMDLSPTTSLKVAKTILKAIKRSNPPLWIPATWDAWIFYYVRKLLPRRLLLPILFLCLPNARHWAKEYTNKRIH